MNVQIGKLVIKESRKLIDLLKDRKYDSVLVFSRSKYRKSKSTRSNDRGLKSTQIDGRKSKPIQGNGRRTANGSHQ